MATAADDDLHDQALVLDRLLIHWPTQLQEADLQRELELGDDDFDHRDRVDRAVANCIGPVSRCTRARSSGRLGPRSIFIC